MENMADSAKAVCDFFGPRMTYINIMRRMSVDCDCAGTSAAEPTLPDLGICASTDILAVDQACWWIRPAAIWFSACPNRSTMTLWNASRAATACVS